MTNVNVDAFRATIDYAEDDGALPDGTLYLTRCPANWNGVAIADLDYRTRRDSAIFQILLQEGYGLAGTQRRADRRYTIDRAGDVERTQMALAKFRARFGTPELAIAYGRSGGGGTALASAEVCADTIDGAVPNCATISFFTQNMVFDFYFAAKALLAPDDDLPFHSLPDDTYDIRERWGRVFEQAFESLAGTARAMLCFTLPQHTAARVTGEPDETVERVRAAILDDVPGVAGRRGLIDRLDLLRSFDEAPPGVPFLAQPSASIVGNDGADYRAYFDNAIPVYRQVVERLYERAGLDLHADLRVVDEAPRVVTDRRSVARLLEEPARCPRGEPRVPVFRMDTTGDRAATTRTYTDLAAARGLSHLVRNSYVDAAGHCTYSTIEEREAIAVMEHRLRTGHWPATDAGALNERSGSRRFLDYELPPFNGDWRITAYTDAFGPEVAARG